MQTIDIKTASWQADHLVLEKVRVVVFVQEQNVPVDIEMDDRDAFCVHVLARHRRRPVGTGRIDIEKHGKIGRVAVLPEYRAQGMGKALMVALEAIAEQAGLMQVWVNAQVSAQGFYEKQGYAAEGETFLEADIVHCRMIKPLGKHLQNS
jgi:predicted GNAT family N-acyltransferase